MIIYPKDWKKDYGTLAEPRFDVDGIIDVVPLIDLLYDILYDIDVRHIAYSGGIDSTVILCLLSHLFEDVSTYTISSREDHPDVLSARLGSERYGTKHHEFIVEPNIDVSDRFLGDNAVRQLFESVQDYTDEIICCDGIDEFMCGYYDHQQHEGVYAAYLERLLPDHLVPLNNSSKYTKVYLPYLDNDLIDMYREIPLSDKVDSRNRKKIMIEIANYLKIPKEFVNRNKYGFCDAFRKEDK